MLQAMSEARRAGRWRTGQQNRQRIIDVARERFMRDGYERATVRAIAADAGVDVAMVYYFFGDKEGLFTVSALADAEPLYQLAALLDEGTEHIGPRLVRRFLEHWDQEPAFEPLLALWRSAAVQPKARNVVHDSLGGPVAARVSTEFGVAGAELRVELVASHLTGLAVARYQLKIEPIASATIDYLVAWVGPTVERYLAHPSPYLLSG